MDLRLTIADDDCLHDAMPTRIDHPTALNGGGLIEVVSDAQPLATAAVGDVERALATACGNALWVRAGNLLERVTGSWPHERDPTRHLRQERLLRLALTAAGWTLRIRRRHPRQPGHALTVHRHDNGWFFAGLSRRTTAALLLRAPDGVPLLIDHDTHLDDGCAVYHLPRAWRAECRVFVDQDRGEDLSCRATNHDTRDWERCLEVDGLIDATVTVYPGRDRPCRAVLNGHWPFVTGEDLEADTVDNRVVYRHVTGHLVLWW